MTFKKKNIYVIIVSLLISLLVIVSSFLGFIVYLQWHQLELSAKQNEILERLDTISYIKEIEVAKIDLSVSFKNILMLDGKVKNNGKREVDSMTLKINFLDRLNQPVYSYLIYPLEPFRAPSFLKEIYLAQFVSLGRISIEPGKTAAFKDILWRCPAKLVKMQRRKAFSSAPGEWCGKIVSEVTWLRLKPT